MIVSVVSSLLKAICIRTLTILDQTPEPLTLLLCCVFTGMILSVVLTTGPGRHAFLLVLDAQDFKEVARARIEAKLGRDTHGYFQRAT